MSSIYKVKQGDTISSIAYANGLLPEVLWNHPDNSKLKQLRGKACILFPGDEVFVPDKQKKQISAETGQRHKFRRKAVPEIFCIRFLDTDNNPRSNLHYRLTVGEQVTEGKTDDKGEIQEWIVPDAKQGNLTLDCGDYEESYDLKIGYLNPINEISGIQARLNNLGYTCGEENGELNDITRAALKNFQRNNDLPITGEADNKTLECLEKLYVY